MISIDYVKVHSHEEPMWQGDMFVKASTAPELEYDLKSMTRDDYIFGIAAAGTNGAETIPEAQLPTG